MNSGRTQDVVESVSHFFRRTLLCLAARSLLKFHKNVLERVITREVHQAVPFAHLTCTLCKAPGYEPGVLKPFGHLLRHIEDASSRSA